MNNKKNITREDYIKKQQIQVYNIDLQKIKVKYGNKEKLNKLERYLLIMVLNNEEKLRKISKGDKVLERVADKIIELNKNEKLKEMYKKDKQEKINLDLLEKILT